MTVITGGLPYYDADTIRAGLPPAEAVAALRSALAAGLDPAADQPRISIQLTHGEFLLMPSEFGVGVGIKVLTIVPDNAARNVPVIQGLYILFDAQTGTPTALLDGIEMTGLRTAAVSLAAVRDRVLAGAHPLRVVVFGGGIQAHSHLRTLFAVAEGRRAVGDVVVAVRRPEAVAVRDLVEPPGVPATVVGIGTPEADRAVARADLVMCTTRSELPLFDGGLVADGATVVCVGAHEPHAREVDDTLIARSTVVVEDPAVAVQSVGAVISAIQAGCYQSARLVPLSACVSTDFAGSPGPLVFISVGMSWEDLVIASAVAAAIA
jgi:ornithine cyclodeaminase/alanine dehydrogenase-like protein (mu-crystallin family)